MASMATSLIGLVLVILLMQQSYGEPIVPCYFSFGDSIVDNGNNNHLKTLAKVNYPPYGVDFPRDASGRFTNGRNLADFIAQLLGFKCFIPPFAAARGDIIKGVNYGSGGAGIRNETGRQQGDRISFNTQLQNHGKTVSRIGCMLRNTTSAQEYLSKCLYTVVIGSNDYLNNYFLPQFYETSRTYTPDQYAAALIRQYKKQLKTLYKYKARKVALFGLGALGCVPQQLNMSGTTSACKDSINAAAELFNKRLRPLVDSLNARLPGASFIYLNATSIQSGDPAAIGLRFFTQPCCQVLKTTGLCIPGSKPCSNRTEYAFYDAFHPTENVYRAFASRAYNSVLPTDAYPWDIHRLAQQRISYATN